MDRKYIRITKAEINLIKNLRNKDVRYEERTFVAEGSRLVLDIIKSKPSDLRLLVATEDWITGQGANLSHFSDLLREISPSQLQSVASLKSTEEVLALVRFPHFTIEDLPLKEFALYLDGLTDPGNVGTLIRTADWFGLDEIMLSPNSVDVFNNKTIQASMSSICRVKTTILPPEEIKSYCGISKLVGADLNGKNLWPANKDWEPSVICLGNEAHGLSEPMRALCDEFWSIPSYSLGAESLNVAISGAIIMANWRSM